MLKGEGIRTDDENDNEASSYLNANVGDDEGHKEYPFVTAPKVLAVMRKLYDVHKKQLVQDFINCACDYETCPKGSYLPKECKPSVSGPYYSCPILHESGDDLFSLPISRKSPRMFKPQQAFMRKPKKRASCRKCSLVTFTHFDASMYHENYLKECTYAKLRTSSNPLISFYTRNSSDDLTTNQSPANQKYLDKEEEAESPCPRDDCCPQEGWADLKELIDPWKPLTVKEDKKSSNKVKKRGKSVTKPVVASRYKEVSKRRSRPNINSLHVSNRMMTEMRKSNNATKNESDSVDDSDNGSKNPFPMPDIFEEIYFGQMPESINSLPVSLQNFKKIQMKMAGESASLKTYESHKNLNVLNINNTNNTNNTGHPPPNQNQNQHSHFESLKMGIKGNSIAATITTPSSNNNNHTNTITSNTTKFKHHLPPLILPTVSTPSTTSATTNVASSTTNNNNSLNHNTNNNNNNNNNKGEIRNSDTVSRAIDQTAEATLNNMSKPLQQQHQRSSLSSTSRRMGSHTTSRSLLQSAGKKKSLLLPTIRKIASRKSSNPVNSVSRPSSQSATRKNKSYSGLTLLREREHGGSKGKKRKKATRRLTTAQRQRAEVVSIDTLLKSTNTGQEGRGLQLHTEVDNSFHDENGKFNPIKYRESLINFIETTDKKNNTLSPHLHNNDHNESGAETYHERIIPYHHQHSDDGALPPKSPNGSLYKSPTIDEVKRKKMLKAKQKNLLSPVITIYKSSQTHVANSIMEIYPSDPSKTSQERHRHGQLVFTNPLIRPSQSTLRNHTNNSKRNIRPRSGTGNGIQHINSSTNHNGKNATIRDRDSKRIWTQAASHGKIIIDKTSSYSYPRTRSHNF